MNWTNWVPKEQAVLCFMEQDDHILLIHKKRGLGKGKINGPGGRIDPGEGPIEAAIRECHEEVGMSPSGLKEVCHLSFEFADGYSLFGYVFWATQFKGTPIETEEARPFWCPKHALPYDKMWEDDRYWLPQVLRGEICSGRFYFDGDKMITKEVKSGLENWPFLLN